MGHEAISGFLIDREAQVDRHTLHAVTNISVLQAEEDRVEIGALVLLHVRQAVGSYVLERVLDTTHVVTRNASGWQVHRRLSRPLHPVQPASG